MSHVVATKIVVHDLDALDAACKELGLTLVRGQKTWSWWGTWANDYSSTDAAYRRGIDTSQYGKGDHAIKVPGTTWEIGVIKNTGKEGGYRLAFDFYGSSGQVITQAVGGNDANKLMQLYGKHKVLLEAKKKGWLASVKTTKNGGLQVTLSGM